MINHYDSLESAVNTQKNLYMIILFFVKSNNKYYKMCRSQACLYSDL